MTEKYDVYSYLWNERFGINFNYLERIVDKGEISWRAKLIKLSKNKNKAKGRYVSWFKDDEGKIISILLNEKCNLLKEILMNCENIISKYSCLIEITFQLKKPYLSKDDDNFYIIDNPIVKEKVFKLPMVRATTWKGALRFAALKVFEEELQNETIAESSWKEKRALLVRLFGNEKDAMEKYLNEIIALKIKGDKSKAGEVEKEFERYLLENGYISKEIPSRAGRLFFYPTFFDQISLEVITPLSRETKTPARGPIYFETVPEGTEGILRIFYYPFDLVAKGEFEKIEEEMKEDIKFLKMALCKMFCETGFSAKKSSGFGTAKVVDYKVQSGSGISNSISSKIEDNDRWFAWLRT